MKRRHFLHAALISAFAAIPAVAQARRPPRIVLRSSWQTVNIGDIGHTPGVLALAREAHPRSRGHALADGCAQRRRGDAVTTLSEAAHRARQDGRLRMRFPPARLRPVSHRARDVAAVAQGDRQTLRRLRHHHGRGGRSGAEDHAQQRPRRLLQGPAQRRELRLPARRRVASGREGRGRDLPGHRVRSGWRLRRRCAQ